MSDTCTSCQKDKYKHPCTKHAACTYSKGKGGGGGLLWNPDDCGLCKQWTAAYAKDRASINELTHVINLVIRHRKISRIANEKLGDFLRDANHKETLSALIIDCIETNRSGSRSRSTSKTVSDKKIQKKVHDLLGSMSSDLSDEEQPAPIQSTIEASPRITARKNQEKRRHSTRSPSTVSSLSEDNYGQEKHHPSKSPHTESRYKNHSSRSRPKSRKRKKRQPSSSSSTSSSSTGYSEKEYHSNHQSQKRHKTCNKK